MADVAWSIICRRAIIDKRTNHLSMIDALDGLNFQMTDNEKSDDTWTAVPVELALVILYRRSDMNEPEEVNSRLFIEGPSNQRFPTIIDGHIDLKASHQSRSITEFLELPFQESGIYWFIVELEQDGEWVEATRAQLILNGTTPE